MKKILAIILMGVFTMAKANAFDMSSTAVRDGLFIAAEYACDGGNISPDLEWDGVPPNAKSLALIMHDPDSKNEHGFYHWIVVDIPVNVMGVARGEKFASPAREIPGDFGAAGYRGPCPPIGGGAHHYHFTMYAMNVEQLDLDAGMTPYQVAAAIKSHSIAATTITGLYRRADSF
ncbi:MAG: YbhB/YbcL family Raf kinase inhibitor-like protein [Alphaproteobacteria bacterium]|nr:YbhB/YbcL family Raf kinase inhibitor-like protein [Alphaproteobacteria bacterium]